MKVEPHPNLDFASFATRPVATKSWCHNCVNKKADQINILCHYSVEIGPYGENELNP
jgi:hypothetical protein